jgi:hypothetical protein
VSVPSVETLGGSLGAAVTLSQWHGAGGVACAFPLLFSLAYASRVHAVSLESCPHLLPGPL